MDFRGGLGPSVEMSGLEPPASGLSDRRSNQMSYISVLDSGGSEMGGATGSARVW